MAIINETPQWEENINLIARADKVEGGRDGVANAPTRQLANRTAFLKDETEKLKDADEKNVKIAVDFLTGGQLDTVRDEIVHGNYRMVWTGAFPKLVPPGSTPESTGGIGGGSWAYTSDAPLRDDISAPDGAGSGISIWDANYNKYKNISVGKTLENLFRHGQVLEWYYDKHGDWNEAHLQSQVNVYRRNLSSQIQAPKGRVIISEPLWHGPALGDLIHERFPELNFYNPETGRYAGVWDFILVGAYCRSSDITGVDTKGTQFILQVDDLNDTRWKDCGIIHAAPKEIDQRRRTAAVLKNWPGNVHLRNFNVAGQTRNGEIAPWMHGIYSYKSGKNLISGINVAGVWGGGIILDWAFEPIVENSMAIGCGRMVRRDYYARGLVDADYMLYAPFQTMFSPSGIVGDNTNFVRVTDCHFEDNLVAADAIIGGSASPVWFTRKHYECATTPASSAANTKKTALAVGGFGVRYLGRDSEEDFDDTAPTVTPGAGQGNVIWEGGAMYSNTYEYLAQLAGSGTLTINNNLQPNTSNVRLRTSGTGAALRGVNSKFGNISLSGGNSNPNPLVLDSCETGVISMSYTHPARLKNVQAEGLVVTNPYDTADTPWLLDGSFGFINTPALHKVQGTVTLTSKTIPSAFRAAKGKLHVAHYAYFADKLLAPLQTSVHETSLQVAAGQNAAALLQEGRYLYPPESTKALTGLPVDGRSVLDVVNETPAAYVEQVCTGVNAGNLAKYNRIIPYNNGVYGTPTAWAKLTN
ncbi:putative prophage endo-N-neuraminidase [Klebsiella pneumoniae]|uniref:tail fiber/spike domain-containing protein n=1 Tax=Klebsiella pneumoniae TaxID=573 RepID=UPI000E03D348|nr:hypothetical protein [Klebsiella pneumoniae]MCD5719487.1 hypothetical protein [Klebsiella pneumoniae]MCP5599658.1 hypothetical protein [Klebsiella pneumoniae]STV89649.1 putative prophage endo-N-neuraminidase [Klebsiella pneumoniae]